MYNSNMSALWSAILATLGLFVLMYVATNLVGMVVRGFPRNANLEEIKQNKDTYDFIKREIAKDNKADNVITVIFIIVTMAFIYLVYQYTNYWVLTGVLLMMLSRIPDLVWEIKTGKNVTRSDKPTGGIYSLTNITALIEFPILWWGIFIWLI